MANKLCVKMTFIPDPKVYNILAPRILDFHKFANQSVFEETPQLKHAL